VLDGVDGRVARLLKGTSRFGAELDSLADFVNFGVAPALILYGFVLNQFKGVGWIAALVFAIAASLRLARFNAMLDDPHRPDWTKAFFVGMPAPAGATCALLPIYLHFLGLELGAIGASLTMAYVLGVAFLMVSTIPTLSGKTMRTRVPRDWVLPLFVLTAAFVGLVVSFPYEMLVACTLLYLATIPVSASRYRRLKEADRRAGAPTAPPAPGEISASSSASDVWRSP
jgi:CDP-diacylglycerol--serine O-phosphatidyltransferase